MKKKLPGKKGGLSPPLKCPHRKDGEVKPVSIGKHIIYAGGGLYFTPKDDTGFDLYIDLREEWLPARTHFGELWVNTLFLPICDFKTVAEEDEETFLKALNNINQRLEGGERILVFCAGGHGRTGLFLASLLAMVEPEHDDPVAELRLRYCSRAVETPAQEAQVKRWHGALLESNEGK